MKFIQGTDRHQLTLFPTCLEDSVDAEAEVRLIDLFVDSLDITSYGFKMDFIDNGRPAYHPGDLLKLFIYGYLNRIRSSRALEKECKRNIELIWLIKGLVPDHNTISNFRKDNSVSIKKVFRATVEMAKYFDLIGGNLIAGDSTKMRAQNSKKNNFNSRKIDRHLAYIEQRLAQYQQELAKEDGDTESINKEIKRQWNFHYIITKRGIDRASADVGFMFTAYNLRRIFNLIDKKALKAYMRALIPCFYRCLARMEAFLSPQAVSKILYPAHRNFLKLAA